jgi:anti-sigma-K factor RskA
MEMSDNSRLEELISLYVIGALEGEELREAERLIIEDTPRVRELLRDYERVVSLLPYSARAEVPGTEVRGVLLEYAKETALKRETAGRGGLFKGFGSIWLGLSGAVAAAVIVFLFVNNLMLRENLNKEKSLLVTVNEKVAGQEQEIVSLKNLLAEKEGMVGGLQAKLASLKEVTDFMKDPEIVLIKLQTTKPEIHAAGRVLWDKKENDALLYCIHLPDPPPGKTYEWWVIVEGVPKSIGVFKVDEEGNSIVKVDTLKKYGKTEKIERFFVTIESGGGSITPKGKHLLTGRSI